MSIHRQAAPLQKLFVIGIILSLAFSSVSASAQTQLQTDEGDRTLEGFSPEPGEAQLTDLPEPAGIDPLLVDNALLMEDSGSMPAIPPEPEPYAPAPGEIVDYSRLVKPDAALSPDPEEPQPEPVQPLPGADDSTDQTLSAEENTPAAVEAVFTNHLLDNFNWANGALSPAWNVLDGTFTIVNGHAEGSGGNALAVHKETGSNRMEGKVATNPANSNLQYTGFVLNYGAGVNNLFIKVQDNSMDAVHQFTHAACYKGNNNSAATFGSGFFELSVPFSSAHMVVSVDASRVVTIVFSQIDGGIGSQTYTCSGAPAPEGPYSGIVGFNNAFMDDVIVEPVTWGISTSFTRQDGPLGPAWVQRAGVLMVSGAKATAPATGHSVATLSGVGGNIATTDVVINPAGGNLQAGGAVLNYGSNSSSVFIKLQDNDDLDGTKAFNTFFCYNGTPGVGGVQVGSGNLPYPITSAVMRVVGFDQAAVVYLYNINGGTAMHSFSCTGWSPSPSASGAGVVSYGGAFVDDFVVHPLSSDDFNRADGPITGWSVKAGSVSISANRVMGSDGALATHLFPGGNQVEADIAINPADPGVRYAALVLNYGAGVNDLFIKIQDNDGNGTFERGYCYTGNNNSAGHFGLGDFALQSAFTGAHLQVSVDAQRTVTILLTGIKGAAPGTPTVQVYTCAGAPTAEGHNAGMGFYGGAFIDNFRTSNGFFYEGFDRSNGSLGPMWVITDNEWNILSGTAQSKVNNVSSRAVFHGMYTPAVEGDLQIKPGIGSLPQFGGFLLNFGSGIDNLFIKIQDNNNDGTFDLGACYYGNNGFGKVFTLASTFTKAHLNVVFSENRTVHLILTKIDGGTGTQVYSCTGIKAPEGLFFGIAGYNGTQIDNVKAYLPYRLKEMIFLPFARK